MKDERPDRVLKAAVVAFATGALFTLVARTGADPDLWGHVRFGQLIAELGLVPRVDPFAYTAGSGTWVNHEWLAEVLFAGLYGEWGTAGLVGFKLAMAGVVFCLAWWHLRRVGVGTLATSVMILFAAFPLRTVFGTVRPMVFTSLLLMIVLLLLGNSRERPWLLWLVPPCMALWINLHGGVLAGIGVLGIWLMGTEVENRLTSRESSSQASSTKSVLMIVVVLSLAALLANPYGWRLPVFLLETATVPRPYISDWRPLDIGSRYGVLYLLATASGGWLITRSRTRLPIPETLLSIVAVVLPLLAIRHLALFGVIWLIVLAGPASDVWQQIGASSTSRSGSRHPLLHFSALLSLGLGAVALVVSGLGEVGCIKSSGEETIEYPRSAVDYLGRTSDSYRMVVYFGWGEYAIWHLGPRIRVSIDGRRETVYPESVYQEYLAFELGLGDWDRHLDEPPADLALVKPSGPSANLLELKDGWTRIFTNARSSLFARDSIASELPSAAMALTSSELADGRLAPRVCFPE